MISVFVTLVYCQRLIIIISHHSTSLEICVPSITVQPVVWRSDLTQGHLEELPGALVAHMVVVASY